MSEKFDDAPPSPESSELKGVSWERNIPDKEAREMGFCLHKGLLPVDLDENPYSLDGMARAEAISIAGAKRMGQQADSISGSTITVGWEDKDSALAKEYKARVDQYVKDLEQ